MDIGAVSACKPTLLVQVACLVVAFVIIEVFMRVGTFIAARTLYRVKRIAVASRVEMAKHLKGGGPVADLVEAELDAFAASDNKGCCGFRTWRERQAQKIATVDNNTDKKEAESLLKSKYTLDAYFADAANDDLFDRFVVHSSSQSLMMQMQHCCAGIFGALALLQTDTVSFVWYCRWGLLLEAGWEFGDYLKNILPKLLTGRGKEVILLILHHFALYGVLPVNLFVVEGPCGPDVAWMLIIMAGLVGPTALITLLKSSLDWKKPNEKLLAQVLTLVVSITFLIARGPLWFWLAYRFWNHAQSQSMAMRSFVAVLIVLFSLFNIFIYVMMFTSIKKIFETRKKKDDTLEKEVHLAMIRGLADPVAFREAHANVGRTLWTKVRAANALCNPSTESKRK